MRYVLATLATLILCGPVAAQDLPLGRDGSENVFVWRDQDAFARAVRLWEAEGRAAVPLVLQLAACVVPTGTLGTITGKPALMLTGVRIITGLHEGCTGVVTDGDVNG